MTAPEDPAQQPPKPDLSGAVSLFLGGVVATGLVAACINPGIVHMLLWLGMPTGALAAYLFLPKAWFRDQAQRPVGPPREHIKPEEHQP